MNGFKFGAVRVAIADKGEVRARVLLLLLSSSCCCCCMAAGVAMGATDGAPWGRCWLHGWLPSAAARHCSQPAGRPARDLPPASHLPPAFLLPAGGFLGPYFTHVGISLVFALMAGGLVRWEKPPLGERCRRHACSPTSLHLLACHSKLFHVPRQLLPLLGSCCGVLCSAGASVKPSRPHPHRLHRPNCPPCPASHIIPGWRLHPLAALWSPWLPAAASQRSRPT